MKIPVGKRRFDDESIGAMQRIPKDKILPPCRRNHSLRNFISILTQAGTKTRAELPHPSGSSLRIRSRWWNAKKSRRRLFQHSRGNVVSSQNRD
jgi:hypothetical protein